MDSKFNINTSQNVNIELKFAGVGERLLAVIIDNLILTGANIALVLLIAALQLEMNIAMVFMVIFSFTATLYHFFMEWLFRGQTFGKRYQKIKVIHKSGVDASAFKVLIRNLIRPIDSLYGLGLLIIFFNKNSQRLGDIAAGTIVIKTQENIDLSDTAFVEVKEEHQPTFSKLEMLKLNEKDMEMIKTVIERDTMSMNWKLVGSLAGKIKAKADIDNDELKSLALLQMVLKDFQYYNS